MTALFLNSLALLLLALNCGAAPVKDAGQPRAADKGYNLLVISVTNIGTEHMSLYGYRRRTTPELGKWAAGALVFEDAFTPASWTLPAGTSLFTSLYPYTHRIMGRNRNMQLSGKIKTLPEVLAAAGFETAAFTGGLDYMGSLGHMRGFLTAPDNPPFTKFDVTMPQASRWLAKNRGKRFFLFVHGYDAHPPFLPSKKFSGVFGSTEGKRVTIDPAFTYRGYRESGSADITAYYHEPRAVHDGFARKGFVSEKKVVLTPDDVDYLRDLYDDKVLETDREVGAFLASLDDALLERTIVVVLSEHGEMFARHGRFGRAGAIRGTLYDDVVHVPLLIKIPGRPGGRVRGLAQLTDVMPTLLELLKVPAPGKIQGKSLMPMVDTGRPINDYVYAGTVYNSYMPETYRPYGVASINESIRNGDWKLIHEVTLPGGKGKKGGAPESEEETFELYDLKADPGEAANLAAARPEVVKDLAGKLKRWAASAKDFIRAKPGSREISGEVLEQAKEHGYW